jgi:uncharacterized protein YidB (DUF937 family)
MGILDALLKNPDLVNDVSKFASENPDIAKAVLSLFSSTDESIGGASGLGDILSRLQSNGLGEQVSSWLSSGKNESVSPEHIESALGSQTLSQFAEQAGLSSGQASQTLSKLMPTIVDKLSPDGKLPDGQSIADAISGFTRG